jgi:hypothetical protein
VPGRYEHNRDPQLAALLHEITAEGWGNDSVGDLAKDGFHASLLIVEPAEQQELTDAFDRDIPAGNWTSTRRRRRPGRPSTTYPTWTALGRRTPPSSRPGRSAVSTRSRWPGPSSGPKLHANEADDARRHTIAAHGRSSQALVGALVSSSSWPSRHSERAGVVTQLLIERGRSVSPVDCSQPPRWLVWCKTSMHSATSPQR